MINSRPLQGEGRTHRTQHKQTPIDNLSGQSLMDKPMKDKTREGKIKVTAINSHQLFDEPLQRYCLAF